MVMPNRKNNYASTSYRYAYNGMELDNEVSGNGNSYTTEFRQYDPRLGRWKSLDPLMAEFPDVSPYMAFNDNPVLFTDPEGLAPGTGGPIQSEYMSWAGVDLGSFGNGLIDGLIGAVPDMAGFLWDLATDSDTRSEFIEGITALASDPLGTIEKVANSKYDLYSSVLSGNGTQQEQYDVGKEIGQLAIGLLTGAAAKKAVDVIKVAQFEKKLTKVVNSADKSTGAGSATARGTKIHKKVDDHYKPKGNGEKGYKDGKPTNKYRAQGSSNPDVTLKKNPNKPKVIYDVKTGKTGMPKKQYTDLQNNLPKGTKIKTVSKDPKTGNYKVKDAKPKTSTTKPKPSTGKPTTSRPKG
jgi:RHS repeat-associated protein